MQQFSCFRKIIFRCTHSEYELLSFIYLNINLCSLDGNCAQPNPKGWTILRQAVSHGEAESACAVQHGMQLAKITSPEEQRVINFLLQTDDQEYGHDIFAKKYYELKIERDS